MSGGLQRHQSALELSSRLRLVASRLQQAPHQVCKGIGVVKAGVAGWRDHIREVIGGQGEVGDLLEAAICVLDVHPVVLQCQDNAVRAACLARSRERCHQDAVCSPLLPPEEFGVVETRAAQRKLVSLQYACMLDHQHLRVTQLWLISQTHVVCNKAQVSRLEVLLGHQALATCSRVPAHLWTTLKACTNEPLRQAKPL